jgi:hypothetical protein
VRRAHLEHLLRAASTISGEHDVVVIGSQSSSPRTPTRPRPTSSTAPSANCRPSTKRFGYYAQGVSTTTAILPTGRRDRLIPLDSADTFPGRGLCLEPHDCVIAKLLAGRPKDLAFAAALIREQLINLSLLAERLDTVTAHPVAIERARAWITSQHPPKGST